MILYDVEGDGGDVVGLWVKLFLCFFDFCQVVSYYVNLVMYIDVVDDFCWIVVLWVVVYEVGYQVVGQ